MTSKYTLEELQNLDISALRKLAADYGLPLRRNMTALDIAKMINDSTSGPAERVSRVQDNSGRPDPGYARIEILRDANPQASNTDVYLAVNGYAVQIKRGMVVDVPIKILRGSLMTSVVEVMRVDETQTDPDKRHKWELVPAYPFTVYDINEGPDPRDTYERTVRSKMVAKKAFKRLNGFWPNSEELRAWKANKDNHEYIEAERKLNEKGE